MAKKSEYGKPTFARSLMEKAGIGDGYGNPAKAKPPKDAQAGNRLTIADAPAKFSQAISKHKQELDQYADGGRVGNATKKGKTQSAPSLPGKKQVNVANKSGTMHGRFGDGGKVGRR